MSETSIYVVKTTANQERSVANMIAQIARKEKYDIRALLVPDVLKATFLWNHQPGDRRSGNSRNTPRTLCDKRCLKYRRG